ncbi:MAG: carboxypeptidase regulatory-like domain-containing protein [Candidatus Bathyarchaeota archaeon]
MRTVSAIFLISISIIYVLSCTASAFGLGATQGQTLAEEPQTTAITEGYILSKHSDYGTDDRDYVQGDILYVWAWSSKVNPYNVRDHYCQIRLDEYVYEFYLNYDQNMTQPNSYTGSFNLSRLEKTGEWTVQIYLRTSPPKPISFDETDVIHVSPKAPPTHELSISSSPISGVTFTLNGANRTTPFSSSLEAGSYTVVMPLNVTIAGKVYSFVEWDNGITSPIRSIDLTKYTAITAYYATPIETTNSTITGKITDNQGNAITEAKVTIVETEEVTYTLSEPAGQYTFEDLTPSNYTIKVEASGYITAQTSVVAEPAKTYTQNFLITPKTTVPPQRIPIELWQLGAVSLTVIGATALLLLWRSRKSFLKEIKKTEYKNTIEIVRLEASLKKLDNLLQKGFLSKERYETLRREAEDELARIQSLKS